jgi:CheY-like chemotaxis protein
MAPEVLNRVFDLFFQADQSLGRTQGGLGIGLSLVRSLVELHGGTVQACSAGAGKGSEFVVRLPLASADDGTRGVAHADEPSAGAAGSSAASACRRVLVVDDNEDIAETTSRLLGLRGHQVKVALTGEEALQLAGSFHPSMVLLDIGMPGLDGFEVCRKLRQQAGGERTTVVAVTGYSGAAKHALALAAGFDHYLIKPVDLDTLNGLLTGGARCALNDEARTSRPPPA